MTTNEPVPRELKWLSILWLVIAVLSLAPLVSLVDGRLTVNVGLLGFFIGPGLYLRKPLARTLALWVTWFYIAAGVTLGIVTLFLPVWPMLIFILIFMVPALIQYDILMKPRIRRIFDPYGRIE